MKSIFTTLATFVTLLSVTEAFTSNNTKEYYYSCKSLIPIQRSHYQYEKFERLTSRYDLKILEHMNEGTIIEATHPTKEGALSRSKNWIRRKMGFQFEGINMSCKKVVDLTN